MLIDYHIHLEADSHLRDCPYTISRIEEYLKVAAGKGVTEIGITEHCNRFVEFAPIMEPVRHGPEAVPRIASWLHDSCTGNLEEYVSFLVSCKERGLPVKLGIEVDYIPGEEEHIREVLSPYPWDFVLGSVHFLGSWAFDVSPEIGWPGRNVDRTFLDYMETLRGAAQSGLFDVLAHPDLIKKFGHRPRGDMTSTLEELMADISRAELAIEVSTAGLRKPVGEIYPSREFLCVARRHGIPITLASDAHSPEEVGMDMEKALDWARACGYNEIVTFSGRHRIIVPLGF